MIILQNKFCEISALVFGNQFVAKMRKQNLDRYSFSRHVQASYISQDINNIPDKEFDVYFFAKVSIILVMSSKYRIIKNPRLIETKQPMDS